MQMQKKGNKNHGGNFGSIQESEAKPYSLLMYIHAKLSFMDIQIQHEEEGHKGAFFIELDGKRVAEMTYVKSGTSRIIIDHTGVGEELKGQGAGKKLVMAAVEMAREKNLKILPLCPFAKSVFEKTPEIQDVL